MGYSVFSKIIIKIKNLYYYVTDKRIIMIAGKKSPVVHAIFHQNLTDFHFDRDVHGTGNLYSSTPMSGKLDPNAVNANICLSNVDNVKAVYNIVLGCKMKIEKESQSVSSLHSDDSSIFSPLAIEGDIIFQHEDPAIKQIEEVSKKMNNLTILLIIAFAIYSSIINIILTNSYDILRVFAPLVLFCLIILLYKLFSKMNS